MSGRRNVERGKELEREVARALRAQGIPAERGARNGVRSGEDVICGLPGVRVECKRARRSVSLRAAFEQAARDDPRSIPMVVHRVDREPAYATIPLSELYAVAEAIAAARGAPIYPPQTP